MAAISKVIKYFKWAGSIYTGNCSVCRKIFFCKSGRSLPVCCSPKCAGLAKRKRIQLKCPTCKKQFEIRPCLYSQNRRHFCSRKCWYAFFQGKNCHLWRRGYWISGQGYRMCVIGGKPKAEHIHIMEKMLGRKMKGRGKEVVHHKDGNKLNNDPSNLALMTSGEHTRLHHLKH